MTNHTKHACKYIVRFTFFETPLFTFDTVFAVLGQYDNLTTREVTEQKGRKSQ